MRQSVDLVCVFVSSLFISAALGEPLDYEPADVYADDAGLEDSKADDGDMFKTLDDDASTIKKFESKETESGLGWGRRFGEADGEEGEGDFVLANTNSNSYEDEEADDEPNIVDVALSSIWHGVGVTAHAGSFVFGAKCEAHTDCVMGCSPVMGRCTMTYGVLIFLFAVYIALYITCNCNDQRYRDDPIGFCDPDQWYD